MGTPRENIAPLVVCLNLHGLKALHPVSSQLVASGYLARQHLGKNRRERDPKPITNGDQRVSRIFNEVLVSNLQARIAAFRKNV
jgi:hypothetical protein